MFFKKVKKTSKSVAAVIYLSCRWQQRVIGKNKRNGEEESDQEVNLYTVC